MKTPGPFQTCTKCNKTVTHHWIEILTYSCDACGKNTKVMYKAMNPVVMLPTPVSKIIKPPVVDRLTKFLNRCHGRI